MEDWNLTEFEARFSSEETCREYLLAGRTVSAVRVAVVESRGLCEKCCCSAAGTIFQDRAALCRCGRWWVTTQKTGASALGLQRVLGLNRYETAWTWLHKMRARWCGRDGWPGQWKSTKATGADSLKALIAVAAWEGHRPDSHEENRGCASESLPCGGVHRLHTAAGQLTPGWRTTFRSRLSAGTSSPRRN